MFVIAKQFLVSFFGLVVSASAGPHVRIDEHWNAHNGNIAMATTVAQKTKQCLVIANLVYARLKQMKK